MGADCLVVTVPVHTLPALLEPDVDFSALREIPIERRTPEPLRRKWSEWLFDPASNADRFIGDLFPSYKNRFVMTLGPVISPDAFMVEANERDPEELHRFIVNWIHESSERLQAYLDRADIPLEDGLSNLVQPAIEAGIPTVVVFTPVDRGSISSTDAATVKALERHFYSRGTIGGAEFWSALNRYPASDPLFTDPVHLRNFEELGGALISELLRLNMLPDTWRTPEP